MKALTLSISKILLLSAVIALPTLVQAQDKCEGFNLSGKYTYGEGQLGQILVEQKGCALTVYDAREKATWTFDLSGNNETRVPPQIIEANKSTEIGYRSLQTMRIKTRIDRSTPYNDKIIIEGIENVPRVEAKARDSGNKYDVDLKFKLTVALGGSGSCSSKGECPISTVTGFGLSFTNVRLLKVNQLWFVGPIGNAFLAGANYILEKLDGSFHAYIQFTRVQ